MSANYVALGDSYAAGVGAGAPTGLCWRSSAGYPVLVAGTLGVRLAYQACLGADIRHVREHQLGALGPSTELVTLTVGGNDIGFVPVLIACAEPAWMRDSDPVIDAALVTLRERLPGLLADLHDEVRAAAAQARRLVAGYPRLFGAHDCHLATFCSDHELRRLNAAADELDAVVARAAEAAGAEFVDVAARFAGHDVCAADPWINGPSPIVVNSFHPDRDGHDAYAEGVLGTLGVTAERLRALDADIEPGPCVPGPAPTFALPDLTSERSLAGAAAHGLDVMEVAALGHRLNIAGVTGFPDEDASARLHEFDAQVRRRTGRP
jgi:lysophospholipase L1-like esterase